MESLRFWVRGKGPLRSMDRAEKGRMYGVLSDEEESTVDAEDVTDAAGEVDEMSVES